MFAITANWIEVCVSLLVCLLLYTWPTPTTQAVVITNAIFIGIDVQRTTEVDDASRPAGLMIVTRGVLSI